MSKVFTGYGKIFQEVQAIELDTESLRDIVQRVKLQPHFLGEPLVVIGEARDFPQVADPESFDLAALDHQGRGVVISLGMGVADTPRDTRALQFAAHLASLRPEELGKIARSFSGRTGNDGVRRAWEERGVEMSDESVELSSLLAAIFERDAEDYAEIINRRQRVLIAAEDFSSRLVNLIQWLVDAGVEAAGLRYRKYLVGGQEIYFAETVVPREDPAVDAAEGRAPAEQVEPWRVKGKVYHAERLVPALAHQLDELLVLTRPATFALNWSHKYYFWIRGERRNLRVRTYGRDRIEIGFHNSTPEALREFLAAYDLDWLEITVVGGYGDSPFVSITDDTEMNERWGRMLCDWLQGNAANQAAAFRPPPPPSGGTGAS